MGFIMEFAENLILRMMEDPKERDRKFRERLYERKDKCQKTKEMWSLPLRPYGFWTFERHNAQIFWDSQISQVPPHPRSFFIFLVQIIGEFKASSFQGVWTETHNVFYRLCAADQL